ncbi:protein FAM131A-like isoform X2 [Sinocyclocheilus rhinocerous]|uniref:protein FAM131A-like isoform X2 n=1 Tax=Sinocyclocheilus rhinocerous TaxID=307959 RepID=UPI0007BA463A|nr:PREDICTED: protein FAM131A-like isoform X2 [Sinocyclocheilus rhinocerous]
MRESSRRETLSSRVAGDRLRVDWSPRSSCSDLALLGNTRTSLARGLGTTFGRSDRYLKVNVEDSNDMLPKSRRALTIQEIAALARSSLHGISQVVKDHVTKPTAMAHGRVAHLIEWKGWCKPTDTPSALESHLTSYSHLSEGEQEARFAAGVAEQFAIAEAKLRAWSSVDGDESNDDSYDEDFLPANEPVTQSTDLSSYPHYLRDLLHTPVCQTHLRGHGLCEAESGVGADLSPPVGSPGSPSDTLCSSMCSLDERHPLLRPGPTADLTTKILGALQGGEELLLARLHRAGHRRGHSPCCLETFSKTFEDEDTPCKDCGGGVYLPPEYSARRKVSDVASSGVVSLDEEEEREEQ